MTSALLPLLLTLLVTTAAADTNYCDISSCIPPSDHTLCLYTSDSPASACGTVLERGVTAADQTTILNAHNTIRRAVKNGDYASNNLPAASVMPDLTWDDELATVAQRWADQCTGGHDKCRNVPLFAVGQNAATTWKPPSQDKDWAADSVGQWFGDELGNFVQNDLTFRSGASSGIGHLTQVIWAASTKIGCGLIGVEDVKNIPNFGPYKLTKRTYICNYGPAGNVEGQQIYQAA